MANERTVRKCGRLSSERTVIALAVVLAAAPAAVDAESVQVALLGGAPARLREARTVYRTPQRVWALPRESSPWREVSFGGNSSGAIPDFSGYLDVQAKKLGFFVWMLPLVEEENLRLRAVRQRLDYIYDHVRWGHELDRDDRVWLADLCVEFRLGDIALQEEGFWHIAFERVDMLPDQLVVVQAANESAWGTSRFAREGNNLFGQWCFSPGCGIVPAQRPPGASYEVARFESVAESVSSYMRNLNTGRSYQHLREVRAAQRLAGRAPDAADLAAGLVDYSERGEEYVAEIRAMLRHNAELIEEARQRTGLTSS